MKEIKWLSYEIIHFIWFLQFPHNMKVWINYQSFLLFYHEELESISKFNCIYKPFECSESNFSSMSLDLKFNVLLQTADFKQIENYCSQCTIFSLHNPVSFNPFEGAE